MIAAAARNVGTIVELDVDVIDVGSNVRVDPGELEGLAASIRAEGLAQPIKAIGPHADGRYRVVYGQRRLLATKLAGLPTITTIVEPSSDVDEAGARRSIVQLVENLQRADLNPIDEAKAIREVLDADKGLTQRALADKLGRSEAWIANALRLLEAEPKVQKAIAGGELSAAHGKVLVSLPAKAQVEWLKDSREGGWSAHELERQVKWRRDAEARVEEQRQTLTKAAELATTKLEELGAAKDDKVFAPSAYGEQSTALQKAIQARGWKFSTGASWPKPTGCDCKGAWRVEIVWDGKVRASVACVKQEHARAKEQAAERKRVELQETNRRLRAQLKDLVAARAPGAIDPTTARFVLWAMLGDWERAEFAKTVQPDAKRPDPWTAITAAPDDVVIARIVERIVSSTSTWKEDAPLEAMLRTLGVVEDAPETVQSQAAERVRAKRAARVAAAAAPAIGSALDDASDAVEMARKAAAS